MISFAEQAHTLIRDGFLHSLLAPLGVEEDDLSPARDRRLENILGRVLDGGRLSREDALYLASVEGPDLLALVAAAKAVRERAKGRVVTYSKNVFVPLTTLCRDNCSYCTFKTEPDEGPLFVPPDQVVRMAGRGAELGCTELLFVTGDKPEKKYKVYRDALAGMGYSSTAEFAAAMSRAVLEKGIFPHTNLGVLQRDELEELRKTNPSMGLMLETVSERLLAEGEAHYGSPDKVPAVRMRTIAEAGELRIPWTSGILVGIGETWEERIDSLIALERVDAEYGHIQEIIIQNFSPKPGIPMERWPVPSVADMVKTVAIARLLFPDKMNIQVPPNLNSDQYPLYVVAGANDLGGVSPITIDYVNPEAPWPQVEKMEEMVGRLGLELRERLPVYPAYLNRDYLTGELYAKAAAMVDGDGYLPKEARSNAEWC